MNSRAVNKILPMYTRKLLIQRQKITATQKASPLSMTEMWLTGPYALKDAECQSASNELFGIHNVRPIA